MIVNLLDVEHIREGFDLHVRETAVQLVLETRGETHARRVTESVRQAGYAEPQYQAAGVRPTARTPSMAPPAPPLPDGPRSEGPAKRRLSLARVLVALVVVAGAIYVLGGGPFSPIRHYSPSAAPSDPAARFAYFQRGAATGDAASTACWRV